MIMAPARISVSLSCSVPFSVAPSPPGEHLRSDALLSPVQSPGPRAEAPQRRCPPPWAQQGRRQQPRQLPLLQWQMATMSRMRCLALLLKGARHEAPRFHGRCSSWVPKRIGCRASPVAA